MDKNKKTVATVSIPTEWSLSSFLVGLQFINVLSSICLPFLVALLST
jgi:hypothetical protein